MSPSWGGSYFLLLCMLLGFSTIAYGGNFNTDFDLLFGDDRVKISDGGQSMSLAMDKYSGSGVATKDQFLFGRFDMKIKLVGGNSAGTVTAFYLSSQGDHHDEVDLEFLGNLTGDPYMLSTNVFANGVGGREVQYYLWFDPTADYHTYSIDWSPTRIILWVDDTPIRVINNKEIIGVPFPTKQPMRLYTTLWNGDAWATRWGQVKIDLSQAPFIARFKNYNGTACVPKKGIADCKGFGASMKKGLDNESKKKLKQVNSKWVVYHYCRDLRRYAHGFPFECRRDNMAHSDNNQ